MLSLDLAKISLKMPHALLRYLEKTTGGGGRGEGSHFDPTMS